MPRLFTFGLGYSAEAIARLLMADGWTVAKAYFRRTQDGADRLTRLGSEPVLFDGYRNLDRSSWRFQRERLHLLASIPADPVDDEFGAALPRATTSPRSRASKWIGYLSTTSVYGVTDGSTVDDDVSNLRSGRAPADSGGWRRNRLGRPCLCPAHVFRLSGIYGPGRSVFDTIRAGRAQRVVKPGHAFNRIHVDDIAAIVTRLFDCARRRHPDESTMSPTICRPRRPIW